MLRVLRFTQSNFTRLKPTSLIRDYHPMGRVVMVWANVWRIWLSESHDQISHGRILQLLTEFGDRSYFQIERSNV